MTFNKFLQNVRDPRSRVKISEFPMVVVPGGSVVGVRGRAVGRSEHKRMTPQMMPRERMQDVLRCVTD